MNLPEGWPTEEMVAAGFEVIHQAAPDERAFRIDLFRAMLAAAPTPPAQDDKLRKAAEEAIADWKKDILSGDGVVLKLIEALEGKSYPFKY